MTVKKGCELCGRDTRGNKGVKFLCRNCNVLFDYKMIGLYIGRFQPFHKGHLEIIRRALKEVKAITIAVAVPLRKTDSDPFSAEERIGMIKAALKKEGINNYDIVAIKDIPSDAEYVAHVRMFTKPFNVVYVGENRLNEKLFSEAGFRIVKSPRFFGISSTEVRKRMKERGNWKELVPEGVSGYIEENGLIERVRGGKI